MTEQTRDRQTDGQTRQIDNGHQSIMYPPYWGGRGHSITMYVWYSGGERRKAAWLLEHTLLVIFVDRSSAGRQKDAQHSDKDDESFQPHGQRTRSTLCQLLSQYLSVCLSVCLSVWLAGWLCHGFSFCQLAYMYF